MKKIRYEYKITIIYLIFGIIWIIFFDKMIVAISNPSNVNLLHSIKGSLFVVFGSLLIFTLHKTHLQKQRQIERDLQKQNQEYEALKEEYKTINSELLKAKEKAEESDKLKTAFLRNISHEIRTPLNAISGFSQIITNPNQSPDKLSKFSEIITQSSNKLIEIITDVIFYYIGNNIYLNMHACGFYSSDDVFYPANP